MTFEWKLPQDYFRVWVKTQWKSAKSDPANHICQCAFCVTINLYPDRHRKERQYS